MTTQGFFITGTDTGVGKTWVTAALMHWFKVHGRRVVGMKPVASGCEIRDGMLRNEDALLLQASASFPVCYDDVNPYAFASPIAPHIASERDARPIRLEIILQRFRALGQGADCVFVEGVGGWAVPLNGTQSVADLATALGLSVVLVVGVKLGCLNHALLSFEAIRRSGVACAGWVANCVDPNCLCIEENIQALEARLDAPLIGVLPYLRAPEFAQLSSHLDCTCLVNCATRLNRVK